MNHTNNTSVQTPLIRSSPSFLKGGDKKYTRTSFSIGDDKSTSILLSSLQTTRKKLSGFTLVELIVVITILAILGTIAFTSLQGFSGSARDSSRVSDINGLSKSLEMSFIQTNSYPSPDNSFSVTYSGGTIWTQWVIGDTVMNILGAGGFRLSKKPTDPLNASKEYTYSKLFYGSAYQIKTDWEGDNITYAPFTKRMVADRSIFQIPEAEAASGNPTLAYIKGNYNGMVAKTQTGSTVYYLLAVPSLFLNTGSGTVILPTTTATGFYINGQTNSGGILFTGSVVFSSGALPSNDTEKALFASNLANAYSGTSLASNPSITSFIGAIGNSGTLASLGDGLLKASLGWNISKKDESVFVCGSTILDADLNSYGTVYMTGAHQCWMTTNLRRGTILANGLTMPSNSTLIEKWCYNNSCLDAMTFGGLYTWAEAMGLDPSCNTSNTGPCNPPEPVQGICPANWHVPTNADWKALVESQSTASCDGGIGPWALECSPAASKLAGGIWATYVGGINGIGFGTSNFNLQPSGYRHIDNSYINRTNSTILWSSTQYNATSVWRRGFDYTLASVVRYVDAKTYGFSLRCIKN